MNKIFLLLTCLILTSGCISQMEKGMSIDDNGTVLGLHLRIPIPLAQNLSLADIKIGYINNCFHAGNNVPVVSKAYHQDINLLTGSGSVKRLFAVGDAVQGSELIFEEKK